MEEDREDEKMSGQYPLSSKEEKIILKMLDKHNVDYENREVSIKISSLNDYDKKESFIETNIYIQCD